MRWLDSIIGSIDMSLSKLQEIVKDSKVWALQSMQLPRIGHYLATNNHHHKNI